ncbi:MAG: hypothetical protein ACR2PO_14090 [Methyloligellaceae bacterium]
MAILVVQGGQQARAEDGLTQSPCDGTLAAKVCLVDPPKQSQRGIGDLRRPCLPGSRNYVSTFLRIYTFYPERLRKEMCGLKRIFVEKSFWASGYADPGGPSIAIRREILDRNLTLSEWATWKEQLSFEGSNGAYRSAAGLPFVSAALPLPISGAAYFIVTHELAHLMDRAFGASEIAPGSFASLSWRAKDEIDAQALSADWPRPCFYLCRRGKLKPARVPELYATLARGAFSSLYATRNPTEDFADTLTFHVLAQQAGFRYRVHYGDGKSWDIRRHLASEAMREKMAFIKSVLQRHDEPTPSTSRPMN